MIFSAMLRALSGRSRWVRVKRKYNVDKNGIYVIFMPDSDRELNEYALRHVDDFLNYRKGTAAVILTADEWTADNSQFFSERIAAVELITHRGCRYYFDYYRYYYDFSERFIMMSLQDGYGERLALSENVNGISKEDMVCLGLYTIRNWAGIASNG